MDWRLRVGVIRRPRWCSCIGRLPGSSDGPCLRHRRLSRDGVWGQDSASRRACRSSASQSARSSAWLASISWLHGSRSHPDVRCSTLALTSHQCCTVHTPERPSNSDAPHGPRRCSRPSAAVFILPLPKGIGRRHHRNFRQCNEVE